MKRGIVGQKGLFGLWHGTSAGILKTVPKYCTVVYIKDKMEEALPKIDKNTDKNLFLLRAATKSCTAGVIGAAITNPFDVLRNEMFKTNLSLRPCLESLFKNEGSKWLSRGMTKNMVAVSLPMSLTIFLTDIFCSFVIT
jgi:hypothetical protein